MKKLFFLLFVANLFFIQAEAKQPLYGTVVIIDPGHGGSDPGAAGKHGGKRVTENEYVYDVALRVARLVKKQEGLVFLTVLDPKEKTPRNWSPREVFPDNRNEVFALDGSIVRARTVGIQKRIAFGEKISRHYPKHRVVWVSIHFDVVKNGVDGVRVVSGKSPALAGMLGNAFGNRLRRNLPLVENGDPRCGLKLIYVISSKNSIREKVLVELGNFRNQKDLWRIRDPKVREEYARAIVRGLVK